MGGEVECVRRKKKEEAAANLRAVVKPPEEVQRSGMTGPNHYSQISLLSSDRHDRSGEIDALDWT